MLSCERGQCLKGGESEATCKKVKIMRKTIRDVNNEMHRIGPVHID